MECGAGLVRRRIRPRRRIVLHDCRGAARWCAAAVQAPAAGTGAGDRGTGETGEFGMTTTRMRMGLLAALCVSTAAYAVRKLTHEDRIEIIRGLSSEYATVKAGLPRSKKPLEFSSNGTWDKAKWAEVGRENGPAARTGDVVQVTKVEINS